MIPKFRTWNSETKEIEVFKTYEEISELFLALSADGGFYSIMQSTCLFDKNGKEIFEGDILRVSDEHSWLEVVSYNQEKAMFVTEEINREFKVPETPLYDLFNTNIFKFEIIGNIYENPELLEVQE